MHSYYINAHIIILRVTLVSNIQIITCSRYDTTTIINTIPTVLGVNVVRIHASRSPDRQCSYGLFVGRYCIVRFCVSDFYSARSTDNIIKIIPNNNEKNDFLALQIGRGMFERVS